MNRLTYRLASQLTVAAVSTLTVALSALLPTTAVKASELDSSGEYRGADPVQSATVLDSSLATSATPESVTIQPIEVLSQVEPQPEKQSVVVAETFNRPIDPIHQSASPVVETEMAVLQSDAVSGVAETQESFPTDEQTAIITPAQLEIQTHPIDPSTQSHPSADTPAVLPAVGEAEEGIATEESAHPTPDQSVEFEVRQLVLEQPDSPTRSFSPPPPLFTLSLGEATEPWQVGLSESSVQIQPGTVPSTALGGDVLGTALSSPSSSQISAAIAISTSASDLVLATNGAPLPDSLEIPAGYMQISGGVYVPREYATATAAPVVVPTQRTASVSSGMTSALAPVSSSLSIGVGSNGALVAYASTLNGNTFPLYPLPQVVPTTSPYGMRWGRLHQGVDLGAPIGTPVLSTLSGKVVFAGWQRGYGRTIIVQHTDGTTRSLYAHLNWIGVQVGQSVQQGQIIGQVGSSGRSTGPHLHWEIQQFTANGSWVAINLNQIAAAARSRLEQGYAVVSAPSVDLSATSTTLRVVLKRDVASLTLGSSTDALIVDAQGNTIGTLPAMQGFQVRDQGVDGLFFIQPTANGMVAVDGRWYRGRVLVARRLGGLSAVNWVDIEDYLASVVGSEAYPSWDEDALMAQAIAARSYAMHYRYHPVSRDWYDIGSDTRYQQYSGVEREFNTTRQAVSNTQGVVLLSNGQVLQAMYAATQAITDSHHDGFGMSQWGAAQLADAGANYLSILNRYYPTAQLGQLVASYR